MSRFAYVLALLMASALIPDAATAEIPVLSGQGALSCRTWTQDRLVGQRIRASLKVQGAMVQEQAWVLGFLSGISVETDGVINPLKGMADVGVWLWIDNHCHDHPIDRIVDAVMGYRYVHP